MAIPATELALPATRPQRVGRFWTRRAAHGRPPGATRHEGEGPVVTFTSLPGTPVHLFAAELAAASGLRLFDDVIPDLVAAELGMDPDDVRALDGVVPSRLEQALVSTALPWLTHEIGGTVAAVCMLERVPWATRAVIERAAADPEGAIIVARGAAFVVGTGGATVHVLVAAPPQWRASASGDAAPSLESADRAFRRSHRVAHGVDATDHRHYDLVIDASVDDPGTIATVIQAELRRRRAR